MALSSDCDTEVAFPAQESIMILVCALLDFLDRRQRRSENVIQSVLPRWLQSATPEVVRSWYSGKAGMPKSFILIFRVAKSSEEGVVDHTNLTSRTVAKQIFVPRVW